MRRTPGARTPTSAGAVTPSSSTTPWRSVRNAPAAGVPPSTSATYSLATPCEGWVSSWDSAPSFVRIKQALGVAVETADGEHAGLGGHQRQHGRPALRVVGRGDDVVRLVQQVVDEVGRRRHQHAVDLDPDGGGVDAPAQHGHLPVDGDAAGGDQLLAGPARSQPRPGQDLLEALAVPLRRRRRPPRRRVRAPTAGRVRGRPPPRDRAGSPPPRAAGRASRVRAAPGRGRSCRTAPAGPGPSAWPTTAM